MQRTSQSKRTLRFLSCLILCIALIYLCFIAYDIKSYTLLSTMIGILSCLPFLFRYEHHKPQAREITIVAVMCALAIAGRVLFAFAPGFKPVSAIVILCGVGFGRESGFLCGAMSAFISNLFFGQGPWTPFQMLSWGIIGYLGGVLNTKGHMEKLLPLCIYGALSGVLFSMVMDIWTSISMDGTLILSRYITFVISALPVMITYSVSNVIFLALIGKTILKKIKRIKMKFGIDPDRS